MCMHLPTRRRRGTGQNGTFTICGLRRDIHNMPTIVNVPLSFPLQRWSSAIPSARHTPTSRGVGRGSDVGWIATKGERKAPVYEICVIVVSKGEEQRLRRFSQMRPH